MREPFDSLVLRVVIAPIVAVLRVFAIYVVIHGHLGPGGGFQGGVLLGASAILPMLLHGEQRGPSERVAIGAACLGVFVFAAVGIVSFAAGGPLLDYSRLPLGPEDPASRRALGILLIEIGVALAVAAVTVSLYRSLIAKEQP